MFLQGYVKFFSFLFANIRIYRTVKASADPAAIALSEATWPDALDPIDDSLLFSS